MKKTIFIKIAATVALLFSILTIVEGSQVLLGIAQQDYTVFTPLLVYNIVMGIAGVFVGSAIWVNYKRVITYIIIVLTAHLTVLIIVILLHLLSNVVAMHSVQAMIIRVSVWLVIVLISWKTNQSKIVNQNNIEINK